MIEDDQRLADMLQTYLQQNGFEVVHASSAQQGLALLQDQSQSYALLLLDLMLPDAFGLDVCRQIRAQQGPIATIPLVMLTAKGDPMDKVIGLELGADDYVAKPFEPRELLARLRALLRRQQQLPAYSPQSLEPARVLRFGRLEIQSDTRRVYLDGRERSLTAYQFDLLLVLAESAGRVLSREHLMDALKGETPDAFDRSIDVHVGRLRAAIEDDPKQPRRIITVRGAGYVFAKLQDV
ncbi:response regulator transcription factor [Undibacterium parvum]|uniref:Response regulator transcription factor n=3 Tax=Undibacterium TaxID=401469 RepID=A0A6M4A8Z7_9BURK|nr:response regulator transcription factor [Undibacterium parvum]QJQ07802.1 response regulator transcription factor [Undibacterium piscinae]